MKKKNKNFRPCAFRLKDEIREEMKKRKEQSGLSWNRYILTLIDKDYKDKINK